MRSPEPVATTTDEALLARVRTGDAVALATLYRRHGAAVHRFACLHAPSRDAAADARQETFLWLATQGATGFDATRSTLAELAHGEAVNKADFGSAYRDGSIYPLGEEPVLLGRVTIKPLQGTTRTLTLLPQKGQGINLELDERLVHVLARLLQQSAVAADWGLNLEVGPGAGAAPAPLHAGGPRLLH